MLAILERSASVEYRTSLRFLMVIQYVQLRDKLKINTVNFRIKDSNQIYRLILDVLGLSRTKKHPVSFSFKRRNYWLLEGITKRTAAISRSFSSFTKPCRQHQLLTPSMHVHVTNNLPVYNFTKTVYMTKVVQITHCSSKSFAFSISYNHQLQRILAPSILIISCMQLQGCLAACSLNPYLNNFTPFLKNIHYTLLCWTELFHTGDLTWILSKCFNTGLENTNPNQTKLAFLDGWYFRPLA